jgi:hypothetical protein
MSSRGARERGGEREGKGEGGEGGMVLLVSIKRRQPGRHHHGDLINNS